MTIEQAIAQYEQFANVCEHHGLTASQEEFEQMIAWLRELQECRKAPEIIRCGECEHFQKEHDGEMWCGVSKGHGIDKDFFCGDEEKENRWRKAEQLNYLSILHGTGILKEILTEMRLIWQSKHSRHNFLAKAQPKAQLLT